MKYLKRTFAAGSVAMLAMGALAAPSAAETYNIGVINAMTGPYAFGGVPIQNAMKLAIKEANASGELGDVELNVVEGDTAGKKGQTITLVSKMAQSDDVLMILGPTTSIEGTAGAPVANDLKVPMFGIGSSPGILAAGPYSFKVQQSGADTLKSLSKYAVEELGVERVSLVFDRSNDGFVDQKNAFKEGLQEAGVEIVSEDGILASDTDFLALATKLAGQDIDAFFTAAPSEVSANVLLQARQGGVPMDVTFLAPSAMASQSFIDTAGKAAENSIIVSDYFIGNPDPRNQKFVETYTETYGEKPANWAALGYALANIGVEAIKQANPDPTREKVMKALTNIEPQTTIVGNGTWSLDDERNPHYGATVLEVKDGEFVVAP